MKLYLAGALVAATGLSLLGAQVLEAPMREYRETSPIVLVGSVLIVLMLAGQLALAKRRKR